MVDPTAAELIARLQRNPQDAAAFAALRNHYAAIGDYVSLANLLEGYAARVGSPEQAAEVFFEAGELWLGQLGNRPRAAQAYGRALERYGAHPAAGARLEQLYRDANDTRAIVQLLEKRAEALAKLDPSGASNRQIAAIHHQLGEMWEHQFQRADRAISHYRKAFELDPSLVVAVYAAREIYRNAGNFKAAAVLYDLEANAEPDPKR
ncbi:MAG: hypothetical protein IT379_04900, partial [Deltaproteobacteria bacterium]|nr:hypothetical protein [Deltaproteobacteria bacterium]